MASNKSQVIHAKARISIARSAFVAKCNLIPQFISSSHSMPSSFVTYRVFVLNMAFSFVARRFGASPSAFGNMSILWLPF
jgi:hypothetical protein